MFHFFVSLKLLFLDCSLTSLHFSSCSLRIRMKGVQRRKVPSRKYKKCRMKINMVLRLLMCFCFWERLPRGL